MNVIQEIDRINKSELANGYVNTPASWHMKYSNSAWVFVGNLPHQLSEGDVIAVMSQWGEIDDINLVRDEATGKSKGFAFLKYEDTRSCILAIDNFNGIKILGRSLRIDHVENYRLPKHLREKEEDNNMEEAKKEESAHGNDILEDNNDLKSGHAYQGKEFENSFNIEKGQDCFAAPAPPSSTTTTTTTTTQHENENYTSASNIEIVLEEKRLRKEERARIRKEREMRREEKEERRREKRARKMNDHKSKKRHHDDESNKDLKKQKRS